MAPWPIPPPAKGPGSHAVPQGTFPEASVTLSFCPPSRLPHYELWFHGHLAGVHPLRTLFTFFLLFSTNLIDSRVIKVFRRSSEALAVWMELYFKAIELYRK